MSSAVYNFPGVYVQESAVPGLAIASSSTAVPVFAHDKSLITQDQMLRIESWLDFMKLVLQGLENPPTENKLYLALEAYFLCGGGMAYLCPVEKLIELVPQYDDVTLLVAAGEDIASAVNTLCVESRFLFGVLDSVQTLTGVPDEDMAAYTPTNYAAVYGPWLNKPKVESLVPPSGAVAGLYAATDRSRGVWKAPANVPLAGGLSPSQRFSETTQGLYNVHGKPLNLFRVFTGVGPLLWGARTLSSDAVQWRYVPVRRLFNTVERDISRALRTMMFEPNHQPTWEKVRAAVDNYLYALWQQGALLGTNATEAYFVRVGLGVTMTQEDIDAGRLIVEVGLNAVRPVEFIILRFTQDIATV